MNSRHVVALIAGIFAAVAAAAFIAILVAGFASIHDQGNNFLLPGYPEDVACGSALRPAETIGYTSDCDTLIASRKGWVKPGLWVSGVGVGLLGLVVLVATVPTGEDTISRYGRNRTRIGG
jgi:hypothetical protein